MVNAIAANIINTINHSNHPFVAIGEIRVLIAGSEHAKQNGLH